MKITIEQLPQYLHHEAAPLYLLSSDESLLREETTTLIRQHFAQTGFTEHAILTPASESHAWDELEHLLSQGLLFAEKQFIEVRVPENKCPEKILKILADFATHPPSARIVLLSFSKLDASVQKTKWFTELEKHSVFIPLWPPRQQAYPQWLQQRCQQNSISLSQDALILLANHTEGNLIAAAQVIQKLSFMEPSTSPVSKEQLLYVLQDESQYDLFDLTDTLLAKNAQRALHILRRLALQHSEPILLLWAITRQVRELLQYNEAVLAGESISTVIQKYRVMPHHRQLVTSLLAKPAVATWQKTLVYAQLIDKMIKGLHPGDPWLALEELCLLLAGIEVSLLTLCSQEEMLSQ